MTLDPPVYMGSGAGSGNEVAIDLTLPTLFQTVQQYRDQVHASSFAKRAVSFRDILRDSDRINLANDV